MAGGMVRYLMAMPNQPDVTQFAESMLHLLQRFTGNRPDALAQMRAQLENELASAREIVARSEAQLKALDQLEALIDTEAAEQIALVPSSAPPLKRAIIAVLNEEPSRRWSRDELFAELIRRGWGPGGANPRNTFTARLRDLELEEKVRRIGKNKFTAPSEGGEFD
jgi:hypothetical protein